MKRLNIMLMVLLFSTQLIANDPYIYRVDLVNVKDDKVMVSLTTPKIKDNETTFLAGETFIRRARHKN